jgi:hypothetical protein
LVVVVGPDVGCGDAPHTR